MNQLSVAVVHVGRVEIYAGIRSLVHPVYAFDVAIFFFYAFNEACLVVGRFEVGKDDSTESLALVVQMLIYTSCRELVHDIVHLRRSIDANHLCELVLAENVLQSLCRTVDHAGRIGRRQVEVTVSQVEATAFAHILRNDEPT